jgi:hypothetical protein
MRHSSIDLHKERLQKFMFGGGNAAEAWPAAEGLEHLVLEEELELQLALLKEKTPKPELFPEVEEKMEELPHLKDNTQQSQLENFVHAAELELAYEETVLGEPVLETLAICGVVAALALAPVLMQ